MNNQSNNPRHQDPSNPSRNNIPNDFFMGQANRPPLDLLNKSDPKMDVNELNDLFMNNFLKNQGPFNQLFDKGGPNPEFFNAQGGNPQNLPFDPNLLYNFPNMAPNKSGSTAAQSEAMNQSNLYFQNMGQMGANFLPMHNFGLNNPDIYGDLLKNPNPNQLNQLDLPDKGMFPPNMLAENPGLMDNQFLFNNLDELNFKPQDGQAPKMNNQGQNMQNMPGLGNFPNPMLFPYGGDLGLNAFMFPPMANFPFEEFYNMQMQGGVPPGGMPHNIGNLPMDLKVENQQTYPKNQGQPNAPSSTKNAPRNNPEPSQQTPRADQKSNPAGAFGNSQDLTLLNGMGMPNVPGMPGMGMPGMPGMPGMGMQGMSGKSMGLGGMGGMFNFPMQGMQGLGFPKDLEPQSNLLKYMTEGMNPNSQIPQENSAKSGAQNPSGNNPANMKESQMPKGMSSNNEEGKMAQAVATEHKQQQQQMQQPSSLTNPDMDLLGKSLLDPFMLNNPAMKKGGYLDGFGFEDQGFLEASSNLFNKIKEKNKYERSLKIERYKNKKRNWQKKIAYDCRKRVADTRLRIKGRFISKKDSEKIQQLVGKQEEAFNDKKNLNLEYLTNKFNISGENDGDSGEGMSGKPSISKGFLLNKIDEILHNNKNPLPPKHIAINHKLSDVIRSHLSAGSKKIFKIKSRRDGEDMIRSDFLNGSQSLKQDPTIKNPLKLKNEAFPDFPNLGSLAGMPGMPGMPNMPNMPPMNMGMKNGFPFPGAPEGFEMPPGQEIDHSMLGNMGNMPMNMNMLEAMASYMGNMGMGMPMNMGMGMPMNIGGFENRPELQQGENGGHDMQRFK